MEGYETDVDVLNAKAVESYFDRMGKTIRQDAGSLAGKTFTHFYSVSWEGAVPTWTSGFEQEFQKYRGYHLRPYLPVLAGMTVTSPEVTQRFLRDYGRSLSDCFLNNCYAKLQELCHRSGLKIHCESGGPWDRNKLLFMHADQLAFLSRNDMPQGEFWHPWKGERSQTNARRAAMTAHIYGRPLAAAEAFTHMTLHWSAYPAVLKPAADAVFCDGVNDFVWHTFTASPPEFGKPGIEYFAGTHINPNVTWWEQSRAYVDYLTRCQFLLRQGQFVADVCCYTGDRNYERWGRGAQWSEKPSLVLPKGYTYDLLNTEVLLERLSVKDGRLVLPDGMSYRMLVVDLEETAAVPGGTAETPRAGRAGCHDCARSASASRSSGSSQLPRLRRGSSSPGRETVGIVRGTFLAHFGPRQSHPRRLVGRALRGKTSAGLCRALRLYPPPPRRRRCLLPRGKRANRRSIPRRGQGARAVESRHRPVPGRGLVSAWRGRPDHGAGHAAGERFGICCLPKAGQPAACRGRQSCARQSGNQGTLPARNPGATLAAGTLRIGNVRSSGKNPRHGQHRGAARLLSPLGSAIRAGLGMRRNP